MANNQAILIGFMGAGKSTVGPEAAEALGVDYYDTDAWLKTESGIDIPHLVRTNEPRFRDLEVNALAELLRKGPSVISTGGGIISTQIARRVLRASGAPVIWLDAPFEVLASRATSDPNNIRPLFEDLDKAQVLFDVRKPHYALTATHRVDAAQPADLVVDEIVEIAQSA